MAKKKKVTKKKVKVQKVLKEQFCPKRGIVAMEALGYKEVEVTEDTGSTLPESVRKAYLSGLKRGDIVYMTKLV